MFGIEEVIGELNREDDHEEKSDNGKEFIIKKHHRLLPPGYRFHPTDEELIAFYLASKVFKPSNFDLGVNIAEVDLNRCEPWELPGKVTYVCVCVLRTSLIQVMMSLFLCFF